MITSLFLSLYPNFPLDSMSLYFTLDHRLITVLWLPSWVLAILIDLVSQLF